MAPPTWTLRWPFGWRMIRNRSPQDALAPSSGTLWSQTRPRTQLLVPPPTWNLRAEDAQVMLTALATTIHSGLAVPRPLPAAIADAASRTGPAEPTGATGAYAWARGVSMTPSPAISLVRSGGCGPDFSADQRRSHRADWYSVHRAAARGHAAGAEPIGAARYPHGLAQQRLAVVGKTIDDLFGAVTILNPGDSYTLPLSTVPSAGAAQRPGCPHPGTAPGRRSTGMTVTDPGEIELPPDTCR